MEHHNVNFNELSKRLAKIGVLEDASALAEKIKRGDFSAVFMLQCRDVLIAEELVAPDVELSDATW